MKPALTIDVRTMMDDVVLLRCRGAIELGPAVELFSATAEAQLRQERAVVLDLREVTRMDARGVGALAELIAAARAPRPRVTLAAASPRVMALVALAGLDRELRPAEPAG